MWYTIQMINNQRAQLEPCSNNAPQTTASIRATNMGISSDQLSAFRWEGVSNTETTLARIVRAPKAIAARRRHSGGQLAALRLSAGRSRRWPLAVLALGAVPWIAMAIILAMLVAVSVLEHVRPVAQRFRA